MDENKLRYKTKLLNQYLEQIENESEFKVIVLKEAINKLSSGTDPHHVEGWVDNLNKLWEAF